MREIKFRIWCKQTDEMHAVERMGFEEGELWYVEDEDRETEPPYFMDRNDSVLMQYTGLKDKNGREIYEGDVISLRNEFAEWKGVAVFDEGAFKLSINRSYGNSLSYFSKTDVFDDMGARTTFNNVYEVIGNIYENPELLEEAK